MSVTWGCDGDVWQKNCRNREREWKRARQENKNNTEPWIGGQNIILLYGFVTRSKSINYIIDFMEIMHCLKNIDEA